MKIKKVAETLDLKSSLLDLSIVIVSWNSKNYVTQCLDSIYKNLHGLYIETVVIDNASFDGLGELLAEDFPHIKFIQLKENVGFAKANNVGILYASGKNILLLNPDTVIMGNALLRLTQELNIYSDAGLIGAHLLNSNFTTQTSCITSLPGIINQSLSSGLLRRLFPQCRIWGMQALFDNSICTVSVEAISGACMLGRRHVIESIGGFSTDYFMYAEDMDFCNKIRRAGWKIYYVPDACIVHHGGCSSSLSNEKCFSDIAQRRSLYLFFRKNHSVLYAYCYRLATMIISFARLAMLAVLYIPMTLTAKRQRVLRGLYKWSAILGWSIGLV